MKANDAPEKLYLLQHNGLVCYCMSNEDDIEYTRTDAFIEKVCEWLDNHSDYQRVLDNGRCVRFDMTQCVSDFRKAMKGE